jgi:hypothetical protein
MKSQAGFTGEPLLNLRGVADALGISERHVQNLRARRQRPDPQMSAEQLFRFLHK